MKDLIQRKNHILLLLQEAKTTGDVVNIRSLSMQAADLEGEIATSLIQTDRLEDAAVNLISSASCLLDAGRPAEAIFVLQDAAGLTSHPQTLAWIRTEIERMEAVGSFTADPAPDSEFSPTLAGGNLAERMGRRIRALLQAIRKGVSVYVQESVAKPPDTSAIPGEIQLGPCTYPERYWRVPQESIVPDFPPLVAELICPHCRHAIGEQEQTNLLRQRGWVCPSCSHVVFVEEGRIH